MELRLRLRFGQSTPMLMWLITAAEPLPIDPGSQRLMRTSMLAEFLLASGHRVLRWSSSFDHGTRTQRVHQDRKVEIRRNYDLWLLHAPGYRKNISLARIRHHRGIAARFKALAVLEERPDIIVCSLPPLELAVAGADYGRKLGVPVVVDIRDMWPDVIAFRSPAQLRPLVRLAVRPMRRTAERACASAVAVLGHTQGFVDWGVRHAGRPLGPLDRAFPFGYESREPDEPDLRAAEAYWDSLGLGRRPDQFIVSYVGAVTHSLQPEPVFAAARILRGRVRFVFCGTGDRLEACRAACRDLPNVTFVGWASQPKTWTLMRRSSVGLVALKSTPDFLLSVPNKVSEYLAAALPIAANFDRGIVCDLLRENQCGFSYGGDAKRLVDQLVALLEDPALWRATATRASALYEAEFRADRIYPRMVEHLLTISASNAAVHHPREQV